MKHLVAFANVQGCIAFAAAVAFIEIWGSGISARLGSHSANAIAGLFIEGRLCTYSAAIVSVLRANAVAKVLVKEWNANIGAIPGDKRAFAAAEIFVQCIASAAHVRGHLASAGDAGA